MMNLPEINAVELIRQVPGLAAVNSRLHSWDQLGKWLVHDYLGSSAEGGASSRVWMRARIEIYRLLATHDPEHSGMREKLRKRFPSKTAALVSEMACWLAEVLGIPVSAAAPLVSVILYRISVSSVQGLLPAETELIG